MDQHAAFTNGIYVCVLDNPPELRQDVDIILQVILEPLLVIELGFTSIVVFVKSIGPRPIAL